MLQLGIVGYPLGHTLSPVLHRFLLQQLGIKGDYVAYKTPPEKLQDTLLYLKTMGVWGVNVTIPHKVTVMHLVSTIDETAQRAGAVNTLVWESGEWHGYNTDVPGFIRGLPPERLLAIKNARVLVLGAGGAARAVVMALVEQHANSVTLCARSQPRAAEVLNKAKIAGRQLNSPTQLAWLSWDKLIDLAPFDWVVNATSLGMHTETDDMPTDAIEVVSPLTPAQIASIPEGALVYDLIYRPAQTRLLQACSARGLETCNGLGMLMHQGIASFERWCGKRVPTALYGPLYEILSAELRPALQ